MKPYGVPRTPAREYPDIADIQAFGMPSHAGKLPEKSGVYKPYVRKAKKRKATRRYFKRKARRQGKQFDE